MIRPKFEIGQVVYNTVSTRGNYEPSMCKLHTRLTIQGVEKHGDTFEYTCGFDGYHFMEDELLSVNEYAEQVAM